MYHCRLKFYLAGAGCQVFEIIKTMLPVEHFEHEFLECEDKNQDLLNAADVIVVNLGESCDLDFLKQALDVKKERAQVLVLADAEAGNALLKSGEKLLDRIQEFWRLPMTDEEIRFRFRQWQKNCKLAVDHWETSQFLNTTINSVQNLIWYKTKDGIHEKVNDSFCQTVNKPKERVEGRDHYYIWDVDPNSGENDCSESDMEVIRQKKTCVSEEIVKTGDSEKIMTTYKSPLYDVDGSVMGTVGVGIDVTQERLYEQEIVRKNRTLEKIFTALDCGVLCHSLDGSRILSVNRAALEILGYESEDELLTDGFDMVAESVIEEDRQNLRTCMHEMTKEGDTASVEYQVKHRDGKVLHVMGNIKLLKEDGELFYQRFLLDVTAQRQEEARKQLRQTELVQALSIDYNLVSFYNLDTRKGTVLRAEEEKDFLPSGWFAGVLSGDISFREIMEYYIREYVYEDDREMVREAMSGESLKKELGEKKLSYVRYRVLRNGIMKYYEMKAVRVGNWEEAREIVLGFRSVDEMVRNEMKQKRLLEDALLQANRANKAKSVFLSNMSHDIRTPMNAIVGFTTLAARHIDEKVLVEEYLQKIIASGNHLVGLLSDVLDMSRIESGKLHLTENAVNIFEMLAEIRDIAQVDAVKKNQRLTMDIREMENLDIFCDKIRVNQVLLNLLNNAVKYTPEGGQIDFIISEQPGANPNMSTYEFRVKDNGVGIGREFLEHIFEPFERERNTTISGIQGTGLGMTIVKNLVDMMNGSVQVNSELGKGTEVVVLLHFKLNSVRKSMEAGKDGKPQAVSKQLSGRILVAEDNELNQEIVQAILTDEGFAVELAENGQKALEMLMASEPGYYQIVLMDIQMPVMNGYEAAKAIRSLPDSELSSIPILAMTANAFEEDRQEALKCGMNGHLTKPVDVKLLFEAIEDYCLS